MAKRLTDCDKWTKVWFRKLSPVNKCFWVYVCDRCDHVGVWEVDFEMASLYIGAELDVESIKTVFNKQFIELNGGSKWLIKDFLFFQYGSMDESNKMFKTIETALKRYGLKMGDIWGINPLKVTVKEKVIVKDKEKGFIDTLKSNPAYEHIDIDQELLKMDVWLSIHKGRQKTKKFVLNWLNKIEKPLPKEKKIKAVRKPDPNCKDCKGTGRLDLGNGKTGECLCVKER